MTAPHDDPSEEGASRAVVPPDEALRRLREGNQRFIQNVRSVDTLLGQTARHALVATQAPFAIVLSCSDSRGAAELVFDLGLGDLFVVRVAGNVVCNTLLGSIEFAVATFDTSLIVVMGHTHCGAVRTTLRSLAPGAPAPSELIGSLVDRIRPSVESALRPGMSSEAILAEATRANVRNSLRALRGRSALIRSRIAAGRLVAVGAEHSLETGAVEFFDGVAG